MDRSPRRLIVKARQIGFSQVIALEAAHEAVTHKDSTILLVSRNGDMAVNLLGYCYAAVASCPDAVPAIVKANESEIGFANGSRIKSLPANRSTGRGFAGRSIYLDEFAHADYAQDIYQSVAPTVAHGGRLTVGSTPDGRGNFFYQLFAGIESGSWSRHVLTWRDCPAYDASWYERERPKYTAQQWASEFEADFVASGQAVFRAEDVEACRQGWIGLQPPQAGHQYVTAWDIGRRNDPTVGITLDVTGPDFQVVAYERLLGVPFPIQQRLIEDRAGRYGGATFVESNNQGDAVVENLRVPVFTWTTTARTKEAALSALILVHEQRRFKHDLAQLRQETLLYQWRDEGLIQDSVIAAAIAVFCAQHEPPSSETVTWDDPIQISPY